MAGGAWTESADRKLLLAIIHATSAPRPDWNTIAGMMGEAYTKESVRQHFQKLQKDNKAAFDDDAASGGGLPDKNRAPAKGKAKTPRSTGKATKKRKGSDREIDDTEESPSKKTATSPVEQEIWFEE